MQDIQDTAIKNYQENMSYFQVNYPALHNKLLALDTLLNEGTYPQKYDLEYKNGYFDIVELETNAYLYNQNSDKFSQELAQQVTYRKNDQTFKSYRRVNFGQETRGVLKEQNTYTTYATTAEISDYYYENSDDSMNMMKIDKFIFLGTGLGLHIKKIIERFKLQVILIIEDNIELFRLSLFTTNYKESLQQCIAFFSVADNSTEFHSQFNNFFLKAFFKNQYIKFNMFTSSYENRIQEIRSQLITRPEATYTHERLLVKSKRVIDKINKGYKFLDLRKKTEEKFFEDKPWLVLGAGPSLQKNSDWIVKKQDKFIIIAAFTSLNTLKRIGVKPDIAVQIDENDFTTNQMIEKLDDLSFLDESLIFFSASVSKLLFDKFDKEQLYLHEDRSKYKLAASTLTVSSVGDTIYTLALLFNVPNIYLLGIDLALGEDGNTHSPDHFKSTTVASVDDNKDNDDDIAAKDFQLNNNTMDVKGNFRALVKTTPLFSLSIPVINYKTKNHKGENQVVYNLSDGAYFEKTVPLRPDEVDIKKNISKKNMHSDLKNLFDSYSTTKLEGKELDALACREAQINDYYNIIEAFKNASHSNQDIFMASYITFVSSICNHKCTFELQELMTIYFLRVASYVDDFINTKEITNKKKHLKNFKSFFITNVKKIITTYEDDLKMLKESAAKNQ